MDANVALFFLLLIHELTESQRTDQSEIIDVEYEIVD